MKATSPSLKDPTLIPFVDDVSKYFILDRAESTMTQNPQATIHLNFKLDPHTKTCSFK